MGLAALSQRDAGNRRETAGLTEAGREHIADLRSWLSELQQKLKVPGGIPSKPFCGLAPRQLTALWEHYPQLAQLLDARQARLEELAASQGVVEEKLRVVWQGLQSRLPMRVKYHDWAAQALENLNELALAEAPEPLRGEYPDRQNN